MTTEQNANPAPNDDAAAQAAAAAAAAEAEKNKPAGPLDINGEPQKPATPEAKTPPANEPQAPTKVEYNPTGDAGLDMALKFVGDLGYGPDHPAMAAAVNGDWSLMRAELAAKDVKGAEAYMALGEKAYKESEAKRGERRKADEKIVHDVMGGAEEWGKVREWAIANADEGEKKEISEMMNAGGLKTRMAAVFLRDAYARANNVSDEGPGQAVSSGKGAPANVGALSPREYGQEVAKARATYKGGDFENSREYKALQARRMAWRG